MINLMKEDPPWVWVEPNNGPCRLDGIKRERILTFLSSQVLQSSPSHLNICIQGSSADYAAFQFGPFSLLRDCQGLCSELRLFSFNKIVYIQYI